MKRSFVLRIDPDIALPKDPIQGQVEDVETGRDAQFQSREQLFKFLEDILGASSYVAEHKTAGNS